MWGMTALIKRMVPKKLVSNTFRAISIGIISIIPVSPTPALFTNKNKTKTKTKTKTKSDSKTENESESENESEL